MGPFIRELVNRTINILIRWSPGDNFQDKLTFMLKKSLLFLFLSLILTTTMTTKFLISNWKLIDLERSVIKIDEYMGKQQENMNQLFQVNAEQHSAIIQLTKDNAVIKDDIYKALKDQKRLENENKVLKNRLREQNKK